MLNSLYILLLLGLAVTGCTQITYNQLAKEGGTPAPFPSVMADPHEYQGKLVVLGGEVLSVKLEDGASLLEVEQIDLDKNYRPAYQGASAGNFLVKSQDWLSPGSYVPKRKVTVVGVVKGKKEGKPILLARKIHLWEYPPWEPWYYPIPREWYDYDPVYEKWYKPPYFDPWRPDGGKH